MMSYVNSSQYSSTCYGFSDKKTVYSNDTLISGSEKTKSAADLTHSTPEIVEIKNLSYFSLIPQSDAFPAVVSA